MEQASQISQQRVEDIKRWYSSTGHWVYDTRAEAVETWITRGIEGKASAPTDARQMLADWVAADPMPALIAKLRAQEAAVA